MKRKEKKNEKKKRTMIQREIKNILNNTKLKI